MMDTDQTHLFEISDYIFLKTHIRVSDKIEIMTLSISAGIVGNNWDLWDDYHKVSLET